LVSTVIILEGKGFLRVKGVAVGSQSVKDFSIINDSEIRFSSETLSSGTFDVSVIDIDNNVSTLFGVLTVTRPEEPFILNPEPVALEPEPDPIVEPELNTETLEDTSLNDPEPDDSTVNDPAPDESIGSEPTPKIEDRAIEDITFGEIDSTIFILSPSEDTSIIPQ